jgi:hypothetical protein
MKVRSNKVYTVTQYNKKGDHPNEYIWSISTPIIGEDPDRKWPRSGRLGTHEECRPEDLRYGIIDLSKEGGMKCVGERGRDYLEIELGWWIFECNGEIVGACSDKLFHRDFIQCD